MKNENLKKEVKVMEEDIIRFGNLVEKYSPDFLNELIRDTDGFLRKRGDILKERLNQ